MAKNPFKLRSGNSPLFKRMGSSPAKQEVRNLTKQEIKNKMTMGHPPLVGGGSKLVKWGKKALKSMDLGTKTERLTALVEAGLGAGLISYLQSDEVREHVIGTQSKGPGDTIMRKKERKQRSIGENLVKTPIGTVPLGSEDIAGDRPHHYRKANIHIPVDKRESRGGVSLKNIWRELRNINE
tara:strand:- start:2 stop:547 length:546 start_codon:yes stop_codon:yes gene_type:complete